MSDKASPKNAACPAAVTMMEQSLERETTVLDPSRIVENLEHMLSRSIILSSCLEALREWLRVCFLRISTKIISWLKFTASFFGGLADPDVAPNDDGVRYSLRIVASGN